jgi:MAX-like protein X
MATPMRASPIQTTTNSYTNVLNLSNSGQEAMQMQTMNATSLDQMQNMHRMQQQQLLGAMSGGQQPDMNAQQQDSYKMSGLQTHSPLSPNYKSYHGHQTPYKIPSQGYVGPQRPRHQSPPTLEQQQQQQQLQAKEMYRSNSLPINATLQLPHKDDVFAVPKYQAKSTSSANNRLRSRSNSMIMKQSSQAGVSFQPNILQTAASEPVLNSMSSSPSPSSSSTSALLAQLLTTNNGPKMEAEQSYLSSTGNVEMKHPLAQYSSYSMPTQTVTQPPPVSSHLGVQKHSKSLPQQLIGNIVPVAAVSSNLTHQSSSGSNSSTSSASSSIQTTTKVSTPCVSPDSVIDSDTPLSPRACSSRDMRRTGHIHAEQKRRYNIKNGFDMLHSLIPQLQHSPNAKLSKAALLQKGAEYIKQLRTERATNTEVMEKLRREKEALNSSLK